MAHVRSSLLTLTVFSLAAAGLLADEKPVDPEPLQVLEDCIQAVAAGDFARYVDLLATDEQNLQAGYVLVMTRGASRALDLGTPITDPEILLLARTMHDLVAQHTVSAKERNAEYQAAEKFLSALAGEPIESPISAPVSQSPGYGPSRPYPPATGYAPFSATMNPSYVIPVERADWTRLAGVLKNPRDFLVAALAELARPTNIAGEEVAESNRLINVGEFAKTAQGLKWTMYTRGDYAIAVAKTPQRTKAVQPNAPAIEPDPPYQIQFQRMDGQWKITRLLPVSAMSAGMQRVSGRVRGGGV